MLAASPRRLLLSRLAVLGTTVALLAGLAATSASPAGAAPATPSFGKAIDALASYQGQTTCDPAEKPGVAGFRSLVRAAYSGVSTGGISRGCDVGGRSEHKEGRAWDWMLRADLAADRAKADDLLGWLLETDQHGNTHAMARRLGVMYVIWDSRWWSAWAPEKGWQPYTGSSPHTDHVHFSFSWDGALKRTSWWNGGTPATGSTSGPTPTASPSPTPRPTSSTSPSPSPTSTPTPTPTPSATPTATAKDPFGELETATATTSSSDGTSAVRAVGWAIDADASTFTRVRLELDGEVVATLVADRYRADVAADNPPYSPNHGFETVVPATAGTRELCATALNQSTGSDQQLGCRSVTVPGPTAASTTSPSPSPTPSPTPTPTPTPTATATPGPTPSTTPSPTTSTGNAPVPRSTDDACPDGDVPSAGFGDTTGSAHAAAIDCAVWWEVARGTGARTFEPDATLTRAQVASFLARTIVAAGVALPTSPADAFDDDDGSVHERAIDQMAMLGVLAGKGGRRYAPDDAVTRDQMATYLVRTHEYRTRRALPEGSDWFGDDDSSVHEKAVNQAATAGFTAGTSATTFGPGLLTTRGQVASFLVRVLDLLVETGWAPDPAA